jgi:LytS/YehU family sensor histidine kinase
MHQENPNIANSLLNSFKAFVGSHFLLNIINSIQSDVILNNTKSAFDTLQRFNRLYKLAIRTSNDQLVLLSTEVELINEYIGLELVRFPKHKFPKINPNGVDPDAYVPSFVFQSLIENAWLLSLESDSKSPKITLVSTAASVTLTLDIQGQLNIHPKLEPKVNLALERLQLLQSHHVIEYQLDWGTNKFMSLTIRTNKKHLC